MPRSNFGPIQMLILKSVQTNRTVHSIHKATKIAKPSISRALYRLKLKGAVEYDGGFEWQLTEYGLISIGSSK